MTPTKRKRLYFEAKLPAPGDVFSIRSRAKLMRNPDPRSRDVRGQKRWDQPHPAERAMVIGFDDKYLTWMFVITLKGVMGWLETSTISQKQSEWDAAEARLKKENEWEL